MNYLIRKQKGRNGVIKMGALLNPTFCKHKWDGPNVSLDKNRHCVSCSWCGIPYLLTNPEQKTQSIIEECRKLDNEIKSKGLKIIDKQYSYWNDSSISKKDRIFIRDGYKCLCCGSTKELSIDHIIPLSVGGNNAMKNLQTLCRDCNSNKSDNTIDFRNPRRIKTVIRSQNISNKLSKIIWNLKNVDSPL